MQCPASMYGDFHCRTPRACVQNGLTHSTVRKFTQATQGPKHVSNLTQAISLDEFQQCHWPLVAYVALFALNALHCERKAKCRSNNARIETRDGVRAYRELHVPGSIGEVQH